MKIGLLSFLLPVFLWFSCGGQKHNIITGQAEGLDPGDRIILAVEDVKTNRFIPVDSAVVQQDGKFRIETNITDNFVAVSYLKPGAPFDPANNQLPQIFLEGYSNLDLSGKADEWFYIVTTGGIYDHPDLQEIFRRKQEALDIQKEAIRLINTSRENGDAETRRQGMELVRNSNGLFKEILPLEIGFAESHPDIAYSAYLIRYEDEDFEEYQRLFNGLSARVQESPAGTYVKQNIEAVLHSAPGSPAPDFTAKTLSGETFTLSAQKGKYILVDFWGSWCGPCRQSSPKLVALYDRFKAAGKPVEFVGIACNEQSDESWTNAIRDDGLHWIHINNAHLPEGQSIQKEYGINAFPTCILISPEGTILYKELPDTVLPELEKLLEM